jgi:hypothetical protein
LIRTLAQQIKNNVNGFNPTKHKTELSGHLHVIGQSIVEAKRLITPLHEEATTK